MKKTLFVLCAACAMILSGCADRNTPKEPTYEYDTYVEPSMNWGAQSMAIQNEMTSNGFTMTGEVYNSGYLLKYYAPRNKEEMTVQFFDQTSLQYLLAQVFVRSGNYSSWTELCNFLNERHTFVDNTADTKIWISKDGKTSIELSTTKKDGTSYDVVTYTPKK